MKFDKKMASVAASAFAVVAIASGIALAAGSGGSHHDGGAGTRPDAQVTVTTTATPTVTPAAPSSTAAAPAKRTAKVVTPSKGIAVQTQEDVVTSEPSDDPVSTPTVVQGHTDDDGIPRAPSPTQKVIPPPTQVIVAPSPSLPSVP